MIPYMIDKIMSYTSVSDKEKINRLLELDCNMYANLGTDSTKTEKLEVKKNSRAIYIHYLSMCSNKDLPILASISLIAL